MELFMVVAVILVAVNMKLPKMLLHNLHRVVYVRLAHMARAATRANRASSESSRLRVMSSSW